MAEVTGLTAPRMLEIEGASIVGAYLSPTSHLILVTRGGVEIDVGSVKGAQGDPGATPSLSDLGILVPAAKINYLSGVTSEVQSQINGKAPMEHTHDDRYYTDTEVDGLLLGKSPTGHTHDDRYFTETEVTNLLNEKASTVHTHDDRYFTEAEVTALLEDKASKADSAYPKFATYYLSADSALLGASKYVSIGFNTKGENSGDFDATWNGHTFSVPVKGVYEITLMVSWTADSTTGNRQQLMYKNPSVTTLNSDSGPSVISGMTGGVMKTMKYAPSSDMTGCTFVWKGVLDPADRVMCYARTTSSTRVAGGTYDSQVIISLERPI